jgi:hypothetical protein
MMSDFDPDAKNIFDGMVEYFHNHPADSDSGLMAWNQLKTCDNAGEDVGGSHRATDGDYSWNAARYPWRIALDYRLYNDQRAYHALTPLNEWIIKNTQSDPKNIAETYRLSGMPETGKGSDSMAFVSMFAVAATIDTSNQQWLDALWKDINEKSISDEDYYGNTLKLLSMITITDHWAKP